MSPSITYWNRLEPSPRSNDLVLPLAAGVADGLWGLTRQWQLGEFEGADAGSPAWIEVDTTTRRMTSWRAGSAGGPINRFSPLENAVGETLPFDLATSIDLGQIFESMLADANLAAAIPTFRTTFPVRAATAAEEASSDDDLLRLRAVAAGRAIDGAALYHAAAAASPIIVDARTAQIPLLIQEFARLVRNHFGGEPAVPSPAWNPKQLESRFEVSVGDAGGFEVQPRADGEVTWEAFSSSTPAPTLGEPPVHMRITQMPASVRFRGRSSGPWWTYDHAAIDVGAIDAERRDLAKLVLSDVLLAQGNEWFVVPIEQEIGTLLHLDAVCVRDVFGLLTLVPPAAEQGTWSMFTTSGASSALGLLLPAGSSAATQYGQALEEIRFVRDDMLAAIWAIEETIEGRAGSPINAYDRAARRAAAAGGAAPSRFGESMPRYLLRTAAPEQRIPYVPHATAAEGELLARMGNGATSIVAAALQITEEELRRTGLRVRRVPARCRDARGETLLRISYIKDFSISKDPPAPRFDALVFQSGSVSDLAVRGQVALIQGKSGTRGDFEAVVSLESGGLAHYSRDNDAPDFPWRVPAIFATDVGVFDSVSLIQSSFGNLEIVARIGDRLTHFWRDAASLEWHQSEVFASGASGTVSLIQGRFGVTGNFEMVAPLASGGIAHFWRDNQTLAWTQATVFAADVGQVADVCLIQGSFGDNFELVARIGDRLAHFWRDTPTQTWNGPTFFAAGVSGTPSFIQSGGNTPGNFEVVAPLAAGGLAHFWRNNFDPQRPWSPPDPFGSGTVNAVALIQSNFDGHLEVLARAGAGLVHYWRESDLPLTWHGPLAVRP